MDPELAALIKDTHRIAKENHRMLRIIRIEAWLGFFSHLAIWVIVIIASLYFYQHYLAQYMGYLPTSAQFQSLLNSYRAASAAHQ